MHCVVVISDKVAAKTAGHVILDSTRFDLDIHAGAGSDCFKDGIETRKRRVSS